MGSNLDLIIVGVFMLVLLVVGAAFGRLVKNSSDYFRAGAQGSWWMVGSSMFMAGISAYTFVGNAAGIYKSGWSPMAIYLANVLSFIISAVFLAAWYRQMRAFTFAEVIRKRFGAVAQQVVAHLLVFNGFLWSGVGLYTLAVFMAPLLPGASINVTIVTVGLVVVVYCTIGGNWAVMANDFVQGLVMISIITIVTVLCFREAGGVGPFFDTLTTSPAAPSLQLIHPAPAGQSDWVTKYGLSWFVITFIVQFVNQTSLFQGVKYFSAKDGRAAAQASLLAGGLMLLGLAVFFVPPIFARLYLEPEVLKMHTNPVKAVEYCYSVASNHVLPTGTFSMMIIAIFAAAISTLDAGLNRNAALIVRDLIPAHRRLLKLGPLSSGRELGLSKIITVLSGGVVMGIAMMYALISNASIFDVMLDIITQLIFPQVIPLLLFLFVRKVPKWSIFSSLAGGYLPTLILWTLTWTTDAVFSYQQRGFFVFLGGTIGFLVSRLFWNRVSTQEKEEILAFYTEFHTPVDFKKEVGEGNDSFQLIMLGRFALLIGGLFLLLFIPIRSVDGRVVIGCISAFVGGIGLMMWLSGKRILKKEAAAKVADRT